MGRRSVRGVITLSPQRMQRLRLAVAVAALAALAAVPSAAEATAKPPGGPGPAPVKRGHHGGVSKPHVPRALSRSAPEAAWVELGPSGAVLARAITQADSCPKLTVDKAAARMEERAAPSLPDYPVRSCESALPPAARRVSLAGRRLPLPRRRPRRIVVVGDTGCRLKAVDGFQACNDPRAWPFARVAKSIARWHPDVVIQVGDYLYREEPCPPGNRGCRGSPFGQNWPTWDADFFSPAAPALRAAPWLFGRGDHELCSRAGPGWFRFLDPGPMPATCQDVTEPYFVDLGRLRMLVLDTALAGDRPPQLVAGISGTLLLPEITAPLVGMDVAGETLATDTTLARHGFFTFVP